MVFPFIICDKLKYTPASNAFNATERSTEGTITTTITMNCRKSSYNPCDFSLFFDALDAS